MSDPIIEFKEWYSAKEKSNVDEMLERAYNAGRIACEGHYSNRVSELESENERMKNIIKAIKDVTR